MRNLIGLVVLALVLAGCGGNPAAPTSVPPASTPAPTVSPVPTAAVGAAVTPQATPSVAQPLVPAFPTATTAFSGAGPLAASQPFPLSAGTYHVTWYTQPIGPAGDVPTWQLTAAIHVEDSTSPDHPLLNVSMASTGAQHGTVVVPDIPAGMYMLTVAAPAACNWTISIA